jgi:hypothetical protein
MLRIAGSAAALGVALLVGSPSFAEGVGCDAFKAAVTRDSGDLKAEFIRPLVVSRGGPSDLDAYDLVSRARVDGVLKCKADVFISFEARIAMPADGDLIDRFARVQRAAAMAAFGWSTGRADREIRDIANEAADYLRASRERGDVSIAGKVEQHLPGSMDLGLIWTPSDRTFVALHNP